jgi:hypothetical protein
MELFMEPLLMGALFIALVVATVGLVRNHARKQYVLLCSYARVTPEMLQRQKPSDDELLDGLERKMIHLRDAARILAGKLSNRGELQQAADMEACADLLPECLADFRKGVARSKSESWKLLAAKCAKVMLKNINLSELGNLLANWHREMGRWVDVASTYAHSLSKNRM